MIYTIGHRESYEICFKEQFPKVPEKLGRTNDHNGRFYQGGSVWKTFNEAKRECPDNYNVYGVEADWDKDTIESMTPNVTYHDLLVNSKLVIL